VYWSDRDDRRNLHWIWWCDQLHFSYNTYNKERRTQLRGRRKNFISDKRAVQLSRFVQQFSAVFTTQR
ncbi:hypothetical protein MKW98_000621, partial [Papaver atlanticum]